jgi:Cu(I)/Ag(I) efflux system membrane protein CusA/SilA
VISRWIDWCARNRFLVFTGTLLLVLAGIWALRQIPLDALPDISDVEVIVHTPWAGEPPSIIEDQVTYPIVTTLLAAPHVKAVRVASFGVHATDYRTAPEGRASGDRTRRDRSWLGL